MALPDQRRRTIARLASFGHAAIAAYCIVKVVTVSGDPGHYYGFRNDATGFRYPAHEVAVWCSVIASELVGTAALLWVVPALASTACLLAVAFGVATVAFGMLAMHAPPYFGMHIVFLLLSAGWLVIVSIAAALLGRGDKETATRLAAAVRPDDAL